MMPPAAALVISCSLCPPEGPRPALWQDRPTGPTPQRWCPRMTRRIGGVSWVTSRPGARSRRGWSPTAPTCHILPDLNAAVLGAVQRRRRQKARRGQAGRHRQRGRPKTGTKKRRGPTAPAKAHGVFTHRHRITPRRANLTASPKRDLTNSRHGEQREKGGRSVEIREECPKNRQVAAFARMRV